MYQFIFSNLFPKFFGKFDNQGILKIILNLLVIIQLI